MSKRGGLSLKIGPGALVAAAFVGPGTVTTCVLAGQGFGFSLLWALVFAAAATITLQEMAARLGAGAGLGLGEALLQMAKSRWTRWLITSLVMAAILLGNAAYQGGNILGAALGGEALVGTEQVPRPVFIIGMGLLAGAALLRGKYQLLERLLIGIVGLMSVAFVSALILVRPDFTMILSGLRPRVPEGSVLTVIALIGTTIVPYNLFLHAAAAKERWFVDRDIRGARLDTLVAISLGGMISAAILIVSANYPPSDDIRNASDLALVLEPSFGPAARVLLGIGLLAAGLSSAITAPMAAGYVASEMISRPGLSKGLVFRVAALGVLLVGVAISSLGVRPTTLILVAQAANGILLPLVAGLLLLLMNRQGILGSHTNKAAVNILGGGVVLLALFFGLRSLAGAGGWA